MPFLYEYNVLYQSWLNNIIAPLNNNRLVDDILCQEYYKSVAALSGFSNELKSWTIIKIKTIRKFNKLNYFA